MWWVDIEVPNDSVDKGSWESSACYPRRTFDSLSESPSTRNSRITMADFRLCSTSRSHSQAGLYHCIQKSDLSPTRAYLRAPPLLFRRHPPQINYPPCKVPPKRRQLDILWWKGGISRYSRGIPPILRNLSRLSMQSYSKGARGLTVWPLVLRIFTENSISLSPCWRQ